MAGAICAVLVGGTLGGCGLAIGPAPSAVQLLVTREFGRSVLYRGGVLHASSGETVLGLLASSVPVHTDSTGQVQSIDGLAAEKTPAGEGAGAASWSYYVNGVQVSQRPAASPVHAGDHIWWDLHNTSQASATQAPVGSFPEPFVNGIEGKRLPVRVECVTAAGRACAAVTASLRAAGVPAAIAAVGSGAAPETLRVIVGPWNRVGGEVGAESIALGPRASGVYARLSGDGQALTLLDAQAGTTQTLGKGAGLVAATRAAKEAPVWVVTGTDERGVELAARAFDRASLQDRFALALEPSGALALPQPEASAAGVR